MAKYKVGEQFIVTITQVDETGMGVTFTLDDSMITTEPVLSMLQRYEKYPRIHPSMPVEPPKDDKPREYTLDELKERIFVLSDLLHKATTAYRESASRLKDSIEAVDRLERD